MSATLITLTGTFQNEDGTAGQGLIEFTLSKPIENADVTYSVSPIMKLLNSTGAFSFQLIANNDPATVPNDSTYIVLERLSSTSQREYEITVPFNAPGATVDISTLMPGAQQPG